MSDLQLMIIMFTFFLLQRWRTSLPRISSCPSTTKENSYSFHDAISNQSLAIIMAIATLFAVLQSSCTKEHLNHLLKSTSHKNFLCHALLLIFITSQTPPSIFWNTLSHFYGCVCDIAACAL